MTFFSLIAFMFFKLFCTSCSRFFMVSIDSSGKGKWSYSTDSTTQAVATG